MLRPKKNSCKEFDNEKKFLKLENSPPSPHNFSNGPSFLHVFDQRTNQNVTLLPYKEKVNYIHCFA